MKALILLAAALYAFAIMGLSRPAHAQSVCMPRAVLIAVIADKFRQSPRMVGIERRGGLMEVFAADDGSWTLIGTGMDGHACIIASGTDLQASGPMELPPNGIEG